MLLLCIFVCVVSMKKIVFKKFFIFLLCVTSLHPSPHPPATFKIFCLLLVLCNWLCSFLPVTCTCGSFKFSDLWIYGFYLLRFLRVIEMTCDFIVFTSIWFVRVAKVSYLMSFSFSWINRKVSGCSSAEVGLFSKSKVSLLPDSGLWK